MTYDIRRKVLASTAIGLALQIGAVSGAWAQTDTGTPQAGGAQIEEVVVTARKVSEDIQRIPVAVTALTGAQLADQTIVRLEDLSNVVPNLILTPSSAAGTGALVYVRGVGSNSSSLYADSPVAVYVDGVLIPHGAGLSFDLPDVDHVEVLRGPQGTLFGRNTTGGAVNIYTTKPTEDFGGSQVISYGSYNQIISKTVLNTGEIGDTNLYAKATFGHDQRDGFANAPGFSRADWAGSRNTNSASFELLWNATDALSFDYRFDWSHAEQRPYAQFEFAAATPLAYYGNSPANGGAPFLVGTKYIGKEYLDPRLQANRVENTGNELTVDWNVSDAFNIKSISATRSLSQNLYPQFMGSAGLLGPVLNPANPANPIEPVGPFINVGEPGHQNQFSEELQVTGTLGDFSYVAGLYYFHEKIGEYLPADITFVLSPTSALQIHKSRRYTNNVDSQAAFGQVSYRPSYFDEKLEVTGGLRFTTDRKSMYEYDTTTSGPSPVSQYLRNSWSNRSALLSVSYQWTPELMTYGRVSNAYKAGGYNPGSLQPAYAPEQALSWEAGAKSQWLDNRLQVNLALYDTIYTNMQISQFNGVNGASQIVNAAKAHFQGGELEVVALLGDSVRLNGSLGYVDPEFVHYFNIDAMGHPVDVAAQALVSGVSHFTANIGAEYEFPHFSFASPRIRVDYAYRSAQNAYTLASLNPYSANLPIDVVRDLSAHLILSDIATGYSEVPLQVQVYGENLLDLHPRTGVVDFGTSLGIASGYYDIGRTVGVELSAKF
ncbi:MAG: TonB-dependent receptor [Rhizomicrobium sp.]